MREATANDLRRDDSRRDGSSLLGEILGRSRFDDRVDTQPDIGTVEALRLLGRCFALLARVPALFAAKCVLRLCVMVQGVLLPWLAKIVIDNALLQRPFGGTEVVYPPFMDPILAMVEGKDPVGIMLTVTTIYLVMLVLIGSRAGGVGGSLLEGRDAATQAENKISAGVTEGGGLFGLTEFMVHVRMSQTLADRLRTRLFDRLTHLPMTVLEDQRIGDSVYRVLYDAPSAPGLAYELTLHPFFLVLGSLLSLYILQYSYGEVSPELIWIGWAAMPVAFISTFPFSGALRRTNQNKRAAGSATTNAMEESMSNIAAVQALGATRQENRRFAERSANAFQRERYAMAVEIFSTLVVTAFFGVAGLYVTVLITNRIIDGSMSPGDFAVLLGTFYGISYAAAHFGRLWLRLQEGIAAVRRVFFFLDFDTDEEREGGRDLPRIRRGVRFDDVSFRYPDGKVALEHIGLDLRIGELVAVVGPTGAGKTTLAYLVPSLILPTAGRVLIDGLDARQIDIRSLRRRVSYVFQEHILLSESIRENLLVANPRATEAQMMAALGTAGCLELVRSLPDGIDTRVGRAGDTFSVGQQQRLSIARGLVRDADVLILDEPTAALDPRTENQLVDSLLAATENRLVIVIAHRLSTIHRADRIVFLEEGRIRDVGDHETLMATPDSPYREFVELQSG